MKNEFNNLLQKEMDRKAFLQHVGIGFAVITGAATLLKTLNGFGSAGVSQQRGNSTSGYGYGAAAYGGKKPIAVQQSAQVTYS